MTDVGTYRTLGAQGFTNPNLMVIENNPAAKQERIEQSAGQITKPANVQIYAPKNDPVATFVGGYKDGDMGASLKEVPTMIETGYSVHSSPNAGAVGSDSANVNKPFSYEGVNIDQLNQTRQPQTDAVLPKVLSQPTQKPTGPVADPTTQLQQQITNDNAARMNALLPIGLGLPAAGTSSRVNAMQDLSNQLKIKD